MSTGVLLLARLSAAVLTIAMLLSACSMGSPEPIASPREVVRPPVCSGLPAPEEFIRVNSRLEDLYGSDFHRFQHELTDFVTRYSNIGGSTFYFPAGVKKVFRSSILTGNATCLEWLAKKESVTSIVNLYSGTLVRERELAFDEEAAFERLGGRSYVHVLGFSDIPRPGRARSDVQRDIADIVRMIAAAPGNVLIHCVGGIHRTGEIYGVLQKCLNRTPIDAVIAEYVAHAGGRVTGNPEYRDTDVAIIRTFDCAQLPWTVQRGSPVW